jgi:hypothetical protein
MPLREKNFRRIIMKKIEIERTKKGYPALWEEGGGMTNTGFAQIVANPDGSPKHPVYIRRRGTLANTEHALFIVSKGDLVIKTDHHRKDFNTNVYRIANITEEEAELQLIASYQQGEWDNNEIEEAMEAVKQNKFHSFYDIAMAIITAEQKATCYHCREPHFIDE